MRVVRRIQGINPSSSAASSPSVVHPLLHIQALRWIYFPNISSGSSSSNLFARWSQAAAAAAAAFQDDQGSHGSSAVAGDHAYEHDDNDDVGGDVDGDDDGDGDGDG